MYIYFHCDAWKNYDSMRLVGVFDETHLRKAVRKDLNEKRVSLDPEYQERLEHLEVTELDKMLEYGYIQELTLNERL